MARVKQPGEGRLADPAGGKKGPRLAEAGERAGLGSPLTDAPQPAGRGRQALPLLDRMADRLLDVGVLAGLHCEDRGEGMPVVRRGDGDDVEGGVVEGRPQIGGDARPLSLLRGDLVGELLGAATIGVADPRHAGPVPAGQLFGMGGAADAAAEDRDGDFIERGCRGVVGLARVPPSPLPQQRRQGRAAGDGPAPREPFPSHRVPLAKKTNLGDVSVSPSAPRSACRGRRPASAGH